MNVLSPSEKGHLMQNTFVVDRYLWPPKDLHILIHETCEYAPLYGKGILRYNYVKGLEMGRLS